MRVQPCMKRTRITRATMGCMPENASTENLGTKLLSQDNASTENLGTDIVGTVERRGKYEYGKWEYG
jgi:hypothetical protein